MNPYKIPLDTRFEIHSNLPKTDSLIHEILTSSEQESQTKKDYDHINSIVNQNPYFKQVLEKYKLHFKAKVEEKMAQEKILFLILEYLEKLKNQIDHTSTEQLEHYNKKKNEIAQEIINVQSGIEDYYKNI